MANQKQSVGGRLAGAKSDPGIPKEEFARGARARAPKPRPRGGFFGCQTAAGAQGAECGVSSSVYPASGKG